MTGAVKTTPIPAMYAFTNKKPLGLEYRCMTQILYEKIIHRKGRKSDKKWVIEVPADQTRKTQRSFKHLVIQEIDKHDKLEPPTKPMNPLDYVNFDIKLELTQHVNKTKDLPSCGQSDSN